MRRATLADVDLIKRILLVSFKNDPHVNWLLEESKNKFKLNVLIDYVVHQTLRRGEIYLSDDHKARLKDFEIRSPRSQYVSQISALLPSAFDWSLTGSTRKRIGKHINESDDPEDDRKGDSCIS